MKKLIILPLGFVLIHVLYIGCCKCIEGDYFRELSSFRAVHYGSIPSANFDTAFVKDTLFTNFNLNYNLITNARPNPFNQLVNAAYATSCNCNPYGDKGFKYPLDSIAIKSDKIFNGAAAGTNLVSLFKGHLNTECSQNSSPVFTYMPVQQLLDSMAVCKRFSALNLVCTILPGAEKIHNFRYTIYSNGKPFEATVKGTVKWQ
jgi:hypothetical protein